MNMDGLKIILKYETVQTKYMMFGKNLILKQFLKKCGKYLSSLPTDDDRSLSVSKRFSKNLKEKFLNYKRKHIASLKLWHEVNTKKIEYFMVDNKQEPWYDPKPSADG